MRFLTDDAVILRVEPHGEDRGNCALDPQFDRHDYPLQSPPLLPDEAVERDRAFEGVCVQHRPDLDVRSHEAEVNLFSDLVQDVLSERAIVGIVDSLDLEISAGLQRLVLAKIWR